MIYQNIVVNTQFLLSELEFLLNNDALPIIDIDALLSYAFSALNNQEEFEQELNRVCFSIIDLDDRICTVHPEVKNFIPLILISSISKAVYRLVEHVHSELCMYGLYINGVFQYDYLGRLNKSDVLFRYYDTKLQYAIRGI